MKKAFYLVLMMVFFLSACQPTPEEAAVVGKTGELEKKIAQPAVAGNPMLEAIPEQWQEETTYQSGVKLVIDAIIEIPDVDAYPVIEALPHKLTIEEAQDYIDILMNGQPVYALSPVRTKGMWAEIIIDVKTRIQNTKNDPDMDEQTRQIMLVGLEEELADYEDMYENAPEDNPERVPAQLSAKPGTDYVQTISMEADLGKNRPAILEIYSAEDGPSNILSFFNGDRQTNYTDEIEPKETFTGMELSRQEAQKVAQELLRKLGVSDMSVAYTEAFADADHKTNSDASMLADDPEIKKCYVFCFCPVVSGIPVTPNKYFHGTQSDSQEVYGQVWLEDKIIVHVDNDGIYRLDWSNRGNLGRVLNENVELLDFERIKEIFNNQMFYQRSWSTPFAEDTTITIYKVTLGMMRGSLKENRYVYLPVWDFIGDWTCTENGNQRGMHDVSLLTINAIDGSVIDRGLGY